MENQVSIVHEKPLFWVHDQQNVHTMQYCAKHKLS